MACDRRCSRGALSGNTPARMKCGDAWPASGVTRRKGRGGACSERSRAEESTFQAVALLRSPRAASATERAPACGSNPEGTPRLNSGAGTRAGRRRDWCLLPRRRRGAPDCLALAFCPRLLVSASFTAWATRRACRRSGVALRRHCAHVVVRTAKGRQRAPATAYTTTGVPLPRRGSAAFACRLALARNCTFPACHAQRPLRTVQPGTDANKDRQGAHGSMGF